MVETKQFLSRFVKDCRIEFNNLSSTFSYDEAMQRKEDVYFLAGVDDISRRNKDEDIKEKNYFGIDLDLRVDQNSISDEEIIQTSNKIVSILDEVESFKDRSAITFTGNGLHIYYIGNFIKINSSFYQHGVEKIYEDFEKVSGYKPDKVCKNIGRIFRLPGTLNYKRSKYNLQPAKCEILHYKENISPLIEKINEYGEERMMREEERRISSQIKYSFPMYRGESVYEEINRIPISDFVCSDFGVEIAKDGKNFVGGYKKGYHGMFIHDNVLINYGSSFLKGMKKEGYNTYSYVKEKYNLSDKDTFERFKNKYQNIKEIDQKNKVVYGNNSEKPITSCKISSDISTLNLTRKTPFTWGLKTVNERFGKMDYHDLVILGGYPSIGKTEFTYFLGRKNAELGVKTLYISLELSAHNLKQRLARKRASVSKLQFQDKSFSEYQGELIKKTYDELGSYKNIEIVSCEGNPDIAFIISTIRSYKEKGFELFFIDNLGKIDGHENEVIRFNDISSSLQNLKNELDICIILLHHLAKPKDKKNQYRPGGSSSFRGSQKIIDNASLVLEIRRDLDPESKGDKTENFLYLYKDTEDGLTGSVSFYFDKGNYHEDPIGEEYF